LAGCIDARIAIALGQRQNAEAGAEALLGMRLAGIDALGRVDDLTASGALASLLASGAKLTDQVLLINALDEDTDGSLSIAAKRIGPRRPSLRAAARSVP
jgi:hypothetical protein